MAQLPNIIQRKRNAFYIIYFVTKESIRASRKAFFLRVFAEAGGTALLFAQFGALSLIINEFTTNGIEGARLIILIIGIGGIILFQLLPGIFQNLSNHYLLITQDSIKTEIAKKIDERLNLIDIATLEQPEFKDLIFSANNRGFGALISIQNWTIEIIKQVTVVLIATITLLFISPISVIILLVGSLPIFLIERKNGINSYRAWDSMVENRRIIGAKTKALTNTYSLIENKNNNALNYFIEKIYTLRNQINRSMWNIDGKATKGNIGSNIASNISFGLAIWFILKNVLLGISTVGSLVFSVSTISRFQSAITMIMRSFGRIGEHSKYMNQVLDILETTPYIPENPKGIKIEVNEENSTIIEFKDVSFKYPGNEKLILNKLNFTIKGGEHTAIVGLNGAGKTTLTKLLSRLYDPTEGEILVNGKNLKDYSLDSWRKHLAIMAQNYSVYTEETITENIMLGNTEIRNEESVYLACQLSTADEFINQLPQKYDQKIGTDFKGGVELSKGQGQKLVIARTWYRRAPFIILDEPTSAVDAVSEDKIFKNLFEHSEEFGYKPTIIVISHKFSNVRKADNIIMLEHGSIIEQGSHDKLIKKNGEYAELFKIQAAGFKD